MRLGMPLVGFMLMSACANSTSVQTANATPIATSVPPAATITLGKGVFQTTGMVSIYAKQSIIFDDTSGSIHHLLTGMNGTYAQATGAPTEFGQAGLMFQPGDVKVVSFPTSGDYYLTCTIHPNMEIHIFVSPDTR